MSEVESGPAEGKQLHRADGEGLGDSTSTTVSRRALLAGAAGALGSAVLGSRALGAASSDPTAQGTGAQRGSVPAGAEPSGPTAPSDPTKVQGRVPVELGTRSTFERPQRLVLQRAPSGASLTPLQDLHGIITPSDLHFERHHAGVPVIDPGTYTLLIHGMVERPMVFTLADLKRYPSTTRIYCIECSGNGRPGYRNIKPESTPQQIDGMVSTSEWTGVPLATLFREVGIREGAAWFLAEAQDAAVMTRSIPTSKGRDDALIAYAQNGEAIRPEQGYPARLLLPGWEGNANVKWIRRIELAREPFMTREETSKYTDPLPDCTARLFSYEMDAKSIITFPAYPVTLRQRGWWEIAGFAWSGRGKVTKVEVSADGGASWHAAELQEPVLSKAQTRFRHLWKWNGGEALLMSRATDETGYVQPTLAELRAARGINTGYHLNNIRAWKVRTDGSVVFALDG